MKVLVTGGAGYVGSTVVPILLAGGHRVRVLDSLLHGGRALLGAWSHPDFEFRQGDVRDKDAVRQAVAGVDAIVHLAAIVGDPACARQPEIARQVNLEASMSLLEEAERAKVRQFVFASTCSNYGKMTDPDVPVDEDAELRPVSLYAETKVAVEKEVLSRGAKDGLRGTALRFATVFGASPRMRFDLTVNEFTLRMLVEKELVVYGEQFWRPYVHVRDAALGIRMILEAPSEKTSGVVYNVGSSQQNFRKQDLVEMILPFAPGTAIKYVHKDEDPRDYRVSFERIRKALGYATSRSVDDGIREVVALVRSGLFTDADDPAVRN